MKAFLKKHRRLCLNVATVALVLLLLGLNILFPYLTQSRAAYLDITPEELYTLSDEMKETCRALQGDITVTFCADPDLLLAYYETRYVYIMAQQVSRLCDNIRVVTVDLAHNPTAVNRYKTTSATEIRADDVIVSCGERYRILSAKAFWALGESSESDTDYYSFNGEYKLATAFLSITSVVEPVVCFAYGHGEHIYVPAEDTDNASLLASSDPERRGFYNLMRDAGLRVVYINLDEEDIPEDCVLLVMDGPTEDYYVKTPNNSISETSALRRIHAFLAERDGSWMLFKDPEVTLPNLEDLSEDWGVAFDNDIYIKDDVQHSLSDAEGSRQKLVVTLSDNQKAVPYSIYGSLLSMGTTPRMIAQDTGAVHGSWINSNVGSSSLTDVYGYYFDFMYSSDGAVDVDIATGDYNIDPADAHAYPLAGLGLRMRHDPKTDNATYAYYFAAATTELTSNTYLEDAAYSNYDVMFATVRFISRTDEYASMELGGTSLNSSRLGGKRLLTVRLSETGNTKYDSDGRVVKTYTALTQGASVAWTVFIIAVPVLAALTVGTVLLLKRKNR